MNINILHMCMEYDICVYDLLQTTALLLATACEQQHRIHKLRVFHDKTQPLHYMDDDELISR